MARRKGGTTRLLVLGGVAVGGYALWSNGTLARLWQQVSSIAEGSSAGGHPLSGRCTGNLEWMVASNPNFVAQMWEWKAQVVTDQVEGSGPLDWASFRRHQIAITGGWDPGANPPLEFCAR